MVSPTAPPTLQTTHHQDQRLITMKIPMIKTKKMAMSDFSSLLCGFVRFWITNRPLHVPTSHTSRNFDWITEGVTRQGYRPKKLCTYKQT